MLVTSSHWFVTRGLRAQTIPSFDKQLLSSGGLEQCQASLKVLGTLQWKKTPSQPRLQGEGSSSEASGKPPTRSDGSEPRHLKLSVSKTELMISRPPPPTAPKARTPSVFSVSAPDPQWPSRAPCHPALHLPHPAYWLARGRRRPLLNRSGIQVSLCVRGLWHRPRPAATEVFSKPTPITSQPCP